MSISRLLLVGCLIAIVAPVERISAKPAFSGIVAFGTTLSDSGNAFAILGEAGTPPDYEMGPFLIPTLPYARGGHHLSNGDTWIEQFGKSLGLGGSVRPALQGSAHATNYAVGAARARDVANNFTLTLQVTTFLLDSGGVADPDALYVIEMGGNDVRDAFASGDPLIAAAIVDAALDSIAANVLRLYQAGAREFLVMNVPNIALTPAVRALGPAAAGPATQATQAFNLGLSAPIVGVLDQLSALPGSSFQLLDAFQLLNDITADPTAFGLTNVEDACVTPDIPPFKCAKPDEFLFWDGIHPTRVGHALLAEEAASVLFP
jgi:phospholipase/lecithinase/hemolysin